MSSLICVPPLLQIVPEEDEMSLGLTVQPEIPFHHEYISLCKEMKHGYA